ncbi:MAG: hypothetical protein IK116_00435 [Firmicutes bacterium]|nr:hypothetical protein [Bacillota bacterium]
MEWDQKSIHMLVERRRDFSCPGRTLPLHQRLEQLRRLRAALLSHEEALERALAEDLGRSRG